MIFRTVLIYFLLFLVIRVMGKRQIGELQTSEFIITILLSEIASAPVTNLNFPLSGAVIPVLILLILELSVSAILLHVDALKRIFYGTPSVLIRKGELDVREMRRNRMEFEELLAELRQAGYSDLTDVNYAILEDNGQLSVFPKAGKAPLTPEDMNLAPNETGISHICILDGRIIPDNLRLAGWDRDRLLSDLASRRLNPKDVFLFSVNDAGEIRCIKKEDVAF